MPGITGKAGVPMPVAQGMVKCPHCEKIIPVRIRVQSMSMAVDYPMSKKDLRKGGPKFAS